MKLALVTDNKIEGSYYKPELFACFPENNKVKMSEREKVEVMFQYGSFVGGVLDSSDLSNAEGIIKEIVQKLKRGCS